MMDYGNLKDKDLVIASGQVEGAARHLVGERMDCGGMRWKVERCRMLLQLRCIGINGEWDRFDDWLSMCVFFCPLHHVDSRPKVGPYSLVFRPVEGRIPKN